MLASCDRVNIIGKRCRLTAGEEATGKLQRFSKQLTYCSAAPDVPDIQSPKDTEMTWLSEVSVLVQIAVGGRAPATVGQALGGTYTRGAFFRLSLLFSLRLVKTSPTR